MGVMTVLTIAGCQGCGACILTCPERAIRAAPGSPAVDPSLCTACGECIEVCPVDAMGFRDEGVNGHLER